MTVLLAAALQGCAFVGADCARTNLQSAATDTAEKTISVAPGIVGAKFGYAGPADDIWQQILALPEEERASIPTLLAKASAMGKPIYEERRATFAARGLGDYGMTLFFASWDANKGSGIHWIDFKMDAGVPVSLWYSGVELYVAQGPAGVQQLAEHAFHLSKPNGTQEAVDAELWLVRYILFARGISPEKLGLPASLRMVGPGGETYHVIPEGTAGGSLILPL